MNFIKFIKLFKVNRFTIDRIFHLVINLFSGKVKCTICSWKGNTFYREYCPICYSQPRHRLLGYILDEIKLNKYDTVLFIGPGPTEILLSKKRKNLKFYFLNKSKGDFINMVHDITEENITSKKFDLIVMWHVLEHIEEDKKAVKNIYHMLKTNGKFLFSVPIYPKNNRITYIPNYTNIENKVKLTGHEDHFICPGNDYPERFAQINFSFLTDFIVKDFNLKIINQFKLSKNHQAWCYHK